MSEKERYTVVELELVRTIAFKSTPNYYHSSGLNFNNNIIESPPSPSNTLSIPILT